MQLKGTALVLSGFALGIVTSALPHAVTSATGSLPELSQKHFLVSIDEVHQNFLFGEDFAGHYAKTVTLSDGSKRSIELTPMIHDGKQVVEFKDTGGHTYMSLNGATTNGKLMVQLRDMDTMHQLQSAEGWAAAGR
jgi:hypothetical protein